MGRYTARRLLQLIPVFFGATLLVYLLVFLLPGDPIRALAGDRPISEGTLNVLRERYNLNDPFLVQYGKYILGLFQGDLGESFRGREVSSILAQSFPITARLAVIAIVWEAIFGIAAGVLAGLRRGSFLDNLVLVSTVAIVSIPVFVLAYLVQITMGLELKDGFSIGSTQVIPPIDFFPLAGVRDWKGYILPAFVLGALSLAYVARLTRTSLVENIRSDYIRTARAKGLKPTRIVGRHALRNSLIPVITYIGVDLGNLMVGAIVTEGIFNIPGMGGQVFGAVRQQEGTVVVGLTTIFIIVFIFSNLLVDLVYAVLDPRIRYE